MTTELSPKDAAARYFAQLELLSGFLRQLSPGDMVMEELSYAQAILRNYISPFLRNPTSHLGHIAVVGGGGAGKSTVVNILLGHNLAESNPQAGYTRHPTAFCTKTLPHYDFLPSLRTVRTPVAPDLDEDLYDIRTSSDDSLPANLILWDNPDVTTIHAGRYIWRVLEVLGLADVIVYVASAQRYNDRVPSQYLAMLARSGKPVVACLTKVPEQDEPTLLKHFREEVLANLARDLPVECVVIPYKSLHELQNPGSMIPYRQQLLHLITNYVDSVSQRKLETCQRLLSYLEVLEDQWRNCARSELEALEQWHDQVTQQRQVVLQRYEQEFLLRERLAIFDEAMLRLIELLELPGAGQWVSGALNLLRLPWRGFRMVWELINPRAASSGPLQGERQLLLEATQAALNQLWREAEGRKGQSFVWRSLGQILPSHSDWHQQILQTVQERFRQYESVRRELIENLACAIYRSIEANPLILNTLRTTKLSTELISIVGVLATAGINLWDIVLVPLVTSLIQALTEFLGSQYVETQREKARSEQKNLIFQQVIEPTWKSIENNEVTARWQELQRALDEMPLLRRRIAGGLRS